MTPETALASRPTTPELLERLEAAWRRSDSLFALVEPDALLERPIPLRHPLLFYVGHLPAFAWNLLCEGVLGRASEREALDRLFAFGIDPREAPDPDAGPSWPPLAEVLAYRDAVRAAVRACGPDLEARAADGAALAAHGRILHLVLEHELMHHETLLYQLQELDPARMRRPPSWPEPVRGAGTPPIERVRIPAGAVDLGVDPGELAFSWDNEEPRRRVEVGAFVLDSRPVTVGELRRFVEDGGYDAAELWSEAGRAWLAEHGARHPKDWVRAGDGSWGLRTLFGTAPLAEVEAWPASVAGVEAEAYARWRGERLPTEAELARAAYTTPDGEEREYPWGEASPSPARGNFDLARGGPTPVGGHPQGRSAWGVDELLGNGWEWTSTTWEAHEGFRPTVDLYAGYSADFFDGEHAVVFGGSWATDARLLRRSFRNWFRPTYPYPFTKFRLARDA